MVDNSSMAYGWYPLWTAIAAAWVLIDARRRLASRSWGLAVALAGPAGLAAYLAFRPLRDGESREGGRAWQVFSKFVVCWTALLALGAVWNVVLPFAEFLPIAVAWGAGALAALLVGVALKKDSQIEHGPTGMLGAMARWYPGPEKSADGLGVRPNPLD